MTDEPYIPDPELNTDPSDPATRNTAPPSAPIEDPEHLAIVAQIEQRLDRMEQQFRIEHLENKDAQRKIVEAVEHLVRVANASATTHEIERRLAAVEHGLEALRSMPSGGNSG